MRALEAEVVDAVWQAVEGLVPAHHDEHPLGCHRPRTPDRLCFRGLLLRLLLGCSWTTVEALLDHAVSDTTLRARRDEWVDAGVFDRLFDEALHAYDRIIGLDLDDIAVDASQQKAPCGGDGTGPNCTDRAKRGWKWSLAVDANGIPIGFAIDGANRHDIILFPATLNDADRRGLLADARRIHLDKAYHSHAIQADCAQRRLTPIIQPRRPARAPRTKGHATYRLSRKRPLRLDGRWTVERTNSWLTNYGQLRRNTDRKPHHRHAQLALAITLIITIKLIDWRDRRSPIR